MAISTMALADSGLQSACDSSNSNRVYLLSRQVEEVGRPYLTCPKFLIDELKSDKNAPWVPAFLGSVYEKCIANGPSSGNSKSLLVSAVELEKVFIAETGQPRNKYSLQDRCWQKFRELSEVDRRALVANYYYDLRRLEEGELATIERISTLASMIGSPSFVNNKTQPSCINADVPKTKIWCEELSKCERTTGRNLYRERLEESKFVLKEVNKLTDEMDKAYRAIPNAGQDAPAIAESVAKPFREKLNAMKTAFPWLQGEFYSDPKTADEEPNVRLDLAIWHEKNEGEKVLKQIRKARACLLGDEAQNCSAEAIQKILTALPSLGSAEKLKDAGQKGDREEFGKQAAFAQAERCLTIRAEHAEIKSTSRKKVATGVLFTGGLAAALLGAPLIATAIDLANIGMQTNEVVNSCLIEASKVLDHPEPPSENPPACGSTATHGPTRISSYQDCVMNTAMLGLAGGMTWKSYKTAKSLATEGKSTVINTVDRSPIQVVAENEGKAKLELFDQNQKPLSILDGPLKPEEMQPGKKIASDLYEDWTLESIDQNGIASLRSSSGKLMQWQSGYIKAHTYTIKVVSTALKEPEIHEIKVLIPSLPGGKPNTKVLEDIKFSIGKLPQGKIFGLGRIRVNVHPSIKNPEFAKQFKLEDFIATATIDSGTRTVDIFVLQSRDALLKAMRHEIGHAIDFDHLIPRNEWIAAMKKDGVAVSKYANVNTSEDIAETIGDFLANDAGFRNFRSTTSNRKRFAARYEYLEKYFKEHIEERVRIVERLKALRMVEVPGMAGTAALIVGETTKIFTSLEESEK